MNLLFVHEVSYRKKVIFEMHEFPELLAERGHTVTFFDFDEGAKFWGGGLTPRKQQIAGRVHPEAALSLVRPLQLGIPGVDRLLATLTSWAGIWRILARGNFDAIVLLAVPTYGIQTITLAKIFGVPVAFRALDVSHKIRNNILGTAIKAVERFVYKRAGLVLGNNPAMTAYCAALGGRDASGKPSQTLLAPLDLSHFEGVAKDSELAASLGLSATDKVITYMGSFFYFSGLDGIIGAFADALKAGNAVDTKLLLIGGGEQDADLRAQVKKLGIEGQVIFTGFVNYAQLPAYLALSTVTINPLKKSLVTDTALPHKVLQYLAMGLPVVSTPLDGLKAVFGIESGIVWGESPTQILQKALDLAGDERAQEQASVAAKQAVADKLGAKKSVDQLEAILTELAKDKGK